MIPSAAPRPIVKKYKTLGDKEVPESSISDESRETVSRNHSLRSSYTIYDY